MTFVEFILEKLTDFNRDFLNKMPIRKKKKRKILNKYTGCLF